MIDQRGPLLIAALGFAALALPSYDRSLHALRSWLDSWAGIGRVAVGMARQGYDLQLTRYDERGWRATFYTTGMEHSPTSATGTGWERTPWHATQRAAWEALKRADCAGLEAILRKSAGSCAARVARGPLSPRLCNTQNSRQQPRRYGYDGVRPPKCGSSPSSTRW